MKITKYIILILFASVSHQSIAQNSQDHWLKKNWNNMVARYNIFFNAEQKLNTSIDNLAKKQVDDFNTIIPIYPYGTEKDAKGMRASMEGAMKKASKVIQNKPRSKWADDAYFIIGQTQFFSGDYYAAIETFQFVNSNYTDPRIKAMSQLWLMKSYIQQEKLDDAEAIYGLLKEIKIADKEFNTHLNLSAGDLLVRQNKKEEASKLLTKGLSQLKDKTLRYRTHFVLGQILLETKKYQKANDNFIKVLRMNAPYEYVFQANLGMAKSTSEAGGQGAQKTKKYLRRMLNDDKNIDYFDQIYFELAKLEFSEKNELEGLNYMQKSANSSKANTSQKTKTYLFLANYFFNNRNYPQAQAYYDSTIAIIPKKYPDADKIKAKHSILSKLIENIETIHVQDSLLLLSTMDKKSLDRKIEKQIEYETEKARLKKEADAIKKEQERLAFRTGGRNSSALTIGANKSNSQWYFYDQSSVARGTNDFNRKWGNRKHGDFWRFVNKSAVKEAATTDPTNKNKDNTNPNTYEGSNDEEQKNALENIEIDKRKYYENIPFSATAQLVAKRRIQVAYLGIGKIYFDDLREYSKSKTYLTSLLDKYPKTKYKPEALFYLSKNERELGDTNAADTYAKQIADDYPETVYNSVLNSKEIEEDNSDNEVIKLYTTMYEAYTNQNYTKTLALKKQIDKNYAGNSIQGKIDYLYALTIGKTNGKEAYIKELDIVKEAYSGTKIGEMAAYTIRLLQKEESKKAPSIYSKNSNDIFYYVITGSTTKEIEVEIQIGEYNDKFYKSSNLRTQSLIFGDRQLFYVKQLSNQTQAMKYHKEMVSSRDFLSAAGLNEISFYAISESNFKKLIKSKEEEPYLEFFDINYN